MNRSGINDSTELAEVPTLKWFEEVYIYICFAGTILQRNNRVNRLFNAVKRDLTLKYESPIYLTSSRFANWVTGNSLRQVG